MIVEQKAGIVKQSGVMDTTEFTIAASAKMFSMLTDQLYSNKITSIVRELSSNACDAHTEAGHKKPFVVTCPTFGKPQFSIRDYGLGLSPEKIKEIYTVLGASDKTASNEFIGCLGIGSKSPFSYTNNFSVTSYQNGKQRIYSCYKNEEGIPAISLLGEIDTKEPDGLLIEIAIPSKDVTAWEQAIRKNYLFYEVLPICNVKVDKATPKLEFKVNNAEIYSYTTDGYGTVKVLMGHNIYDLNRIFACVEFDIPYGKSLIINVPIGTVSVDISRERLQFDKKTEQALTFIMSDVKKHLLKSIQENIDKAESEYEAILAVREMDGIKLKNLYNLLTYKGQALYDLFNKSISLNYTNMYVQKGRKTWKAYNLSFEKNIKYIVDDSKVHPKRLAEEYLQNNEKALFIKPKDEVKECIESIVKFGIPEKFILLTSKLGLKKKNGAYKPIKVMQLCGSALVEVKASPGPNDYYIERDGNNVGVDTKYKTIFKILGVQPYGLTKTQIKKLGCKSLEKELPDLIEKFLKSKGITQKYSSVTFYHQQLIKWLSNEFPQIQDFKDWLNKHDNFVKEQSKVDGIIPYNVKELMLKQLPVKSLDIDAEINKKYPICQVLTTNLHLSAACKDELLNYFVEKNNA